MALFPAAPVGHEAHLVALLRDSAPLRRAFFGRGVRLRHWLIPEATMIPVEGAPASFPVLPLPSHDILCAHLGLGAEELAWFADLRRMNASRAPSEASARKLTHYHYQWVAKARGGFRLLEAPKPRLKRIQRWLLRAMLAPIPVSDAAHGFVRGRSVRTFVAPHVGRAVVVRLDLEDFFGSISRARVVATFLRLGYPRGIAETLAGLCTAPTPDWVLAAHPRERTTDLGAAVPEQRAPARRAPAPGRADLTGAEQPRRLAADRRLAALAAGFGATMTRYADDSAFAGDEAFDRALRFFLPQAAAIVLEEGFRVNHRKTRVMRPDQRQELCGVVVNDRPNLPRAERDRLRAILHNAARLGPESQNREGPRRLSPPPRGARRLGGTLEPRLRPAGPPAAWPDQLDRTDVT